MDIPKKVKIGASIYKIKSVSTNEDNKDFDGKIDYRNLTIELKDHLSGTFKEFVFLHELMHGINDFLGMRMSEKDTDRYARAIHMIITDNSELFK